MEANKLAEAIRQGDTLAYEIFFRAEYLNVVSFLSKYTKDRDMAQDLAQDSFVQLWNTRDRIDSCKNLRSYVFTIARNLAINRLQRKAHKSRKSIEDPDVRLRVEALAHPSVSAGIEGLELSALIGTVYAELPDNILRSFVMSREMGMTYREIARKRGISQKSVEYHIKIALQLFRTRLKDYLLVFVMVIGSLLK